MGPPDGRVNQGEQAGRGAEQGSATIWFAGFIAALMLMGLLFTAGLGVWAEKARLQAVANMASLAGADQSALNVFGGPPTAGACELAAAVVQANQAEVHACSVQGADTLITVKVDRNFGFLRVPIQARARAGPS